MKLTTRADGPLSALGVDSGCGLTDPAPSVPDLLVAAIAERAGLVVLHQDKDFELIAQITGQPAERLED